MRLVVDTNVIVSALLHPGRTPDVALTRILEGEHVVLVDDRVRAEYADVLARKKFASIDLERRARLLAAVEARAETVVVSPSEIVLIDEDDRVFIEVAESGRADGIVTGNTKHFPRDRGFRVWNPAEWLAAIDSTGNDSR
jgi:putative PIN family toxin of toxin-antitoxin system